MGKVSINTSFSNIFQNLLLPAIFHQNCQAAFGRCEYFLGTEWVNDGQCRIVDRNMFTLGSGSMCSFTVVVINTHDLYK